MVFLKLFLVFLQIGAISFGGGYSILKAIAHYVVDNYKWLSMDEFNNIIAISQSTPGPIGINAATFVGYKVGSFLGALIATLSVIIVPATLSISIYSLYRKHSHDESVKEIISKLKPVILAMVTSAALGFIQNAFGSIFSSVVTLFSFALLFLMDIDVIILLVVSGIINLVFFN